MERTRIVGEHILSRPIMSVGKLWMRRGISWLISVLFCMTHGWAQIQSPIAGHYPPGQSGIRGAASPSPSIAYTNFSRFFSNLEIRDGSGDIAQELNELRFANISMVTFTSDLKLFGLTYGALAGIPFSTGNIQPSAQDAGSLSFGLGDVLVTPLAMYYGSASLDYQIQFTVWTPSGKFTPGGSDNRGAGYWALVYSVGGAFFPAGDREAWSFSAIARIEQNFEQKESGIQPGDDVVIDWGVGKLIEPGDQKIEAGLSGFATWQLTHQSGGKQGAKIGTYHYFGIGPEASFPATGNLAFRFRAHWEFAALNSVQGNNLWIIANYRF